MNASDKLKIVGLAALLLFTPLPGTAATPDAFAATEHFFPLIVNGEGFRNRIFMTNVSELSNPCVFSLHGEARSMSISLGADSALLPRGDDTMFELPDGAGASLTLTSIDGNAPTFGYAKLECTGPVAAWLLLSLESGGTVLSLAALEGANPGAAFQFPVLSRLGRLAMAFSNEADLDTVCSAELEDGMGAILGGGSFTVPAASSTLRFLDELIPAPDGVEAGKVRVSCARDVAAVGLPLDGALFTMLSATMLDRHETARSSHILPLIADGGGFRSQILLTNLADSSNRCVLGLGGGVFDADRFEIPSGAAVTGSSIAVELAAKSDQASMRSKGGQSPAWWGYATVECESLVAARNMLTLDEGGHLTGMAAVPGTQPADGMEFPVMPALGRLMLAIANDTVSATSCAIELRANGVAISSAEPFAVASQSTSLRFLDELLAVPDDFPGGTARLTCFGEIAATSLLAGGTVFATMRQAISPVRLNPVSVRTIPDHKLRVLIARQLGVAPEAEIRASDLARLRELDARNAGIGSLEGLEHATGLTRLDLGPAPWDPDLGIVNSNRVADLAPILGLSNLEHLNIRRNRLTGSIPAELGNLPNLEVLWMGGNRLSGEIPRQLGNLRNLAQLGIAFNRLSGPIPPELGDLPNLTSLNLSGNTLSGPIPRELGNLGELTALSLGGNRLTGSIPNELGDLPNLTSLSLSENTLSGPIPRELGNLGELTALSLNENRLTGSIPNELGDLRNLTFLNLRANALDGTIPRELSDLRGLTLLSLADNNLSGTIPRELGSLENLTALNLGTNQLSGAIPSEIGLLASLKSLRLGNNMLIGEIPPAIGNLVGIENLRLESNQLSGRIPSELRQLAELTDLWLGHNELSGSIPAELGFLPNLESLRLGNNRLSGTIPRELGNAASLKELWLDDNELSGPVPAELGLLPSLESLTLSNNRLTGEIPDEVGGLADRIEVWLRGNLLTGRIPDGPLPVRVGLLEPGPTADEQITVTLAEALNSRWFRRPTEVGAYPVAPGGDGPGMFVAELEGRIMLLRPDDGESVVLLDIGGRVSRLGSQDGLLGVTLDPHYDENGHLYVSYWTLGHPVSFRVSRFTANLPGLQRVDSGSELVILEIEQPSRYHAGGALRFGPDGMLYVALGDGQPNNDPDGNGQNLETLQGSIVRIDVTAASEASPYAVPSDNPFTGIPSARPEIWAHGFRHPWRMAFDPATGELWAGDVGQDRLEEINRIEAGGNYGWNHLEGTLCFNPPQGCGRMGTVPPIVEYGHHLGCAVTGGVVYRGSAIPALAGHYLFSDSCSGRLWALRPDGGDVIEIGVSPRRVLSFGTDADGEVYLSTLEGSVLRIEPPTR